MQDFVRIAVTTDLDRDRVLERASAALQGFKWRGGDSDMQGPYVTGTNARGVKVQIWLGEAPADVTLSFHQIKPYMAGDSLFKDETLNQLKAFLATLGSVDRVTWIDDD